MAIAVTRVYDRWLDLLDGDEVRHLSDVHKASLETFLPTLNLAISTEESMAINRMKGGAIIIAGSGMCTGGRIRHHFKQRIWDDRNTIIFTGYQAQGTLGRVLVDGAKRVKIFNEEYVIKCQIETLGGLSAHAGQSGCCAGWATSNHRHVRYWCTVNRVPRTHCGTSFGRSRGWRWRCPPAARVSFTDLATARDVAND